MFPEPIVSTNIYCNKRLDELTHRAIAPFWRRFKKEEDTEGFCYIWSLRYAKCGEHLKLRLHGPEDFKGALQRGLTEVVSSYFETLGDLDLESERVSNGALPPIDSEDESLADYPDRSILWTRYRPSPITMGSPILLDDSHLAALFTRCLGEGNAIVLNSLEPDSAGNFLTRTRQSIIMKLVITGFTALRFHPDKRLAYLAYHRDWLIRYLLFKSDPQNSSRAEILERLDAKLHTNLSTIDTVAGVLVSQDRHASSLQASEHADWARSLASLFQHLQRFREDPRYDLDPYAVDPVFLPLFKLFHGVANQAGLGIPNEIYLYHLLMAAADRPAARGVEPPEANG